MYSVHTVRFFASYVIFREFCDRMLFEADYICEIASYRYIGSPESGNSDKISALFPT